MAAEPRDADELRVILGKDALGARRAHDGGARALRQAAHEGGCLARAEASPDGERSVGQELERSVRSSPRRGVSPSVQLMATSGSGSVHASA